MGAFEAIIAQNNTHCAENVLFVGIFLQKSKNYSYLCTTKRNKATKKKIIINILNI